MGKLVSWAGKRAVLACFDALSALLVAAIVLLCLPAPAHAYVDPSVMTYTIQALAGVAVALGAVAGVALRRTRKALFKALNIDENANKTVELEVSRCNPGEAPGEPRYRKKGRTLDSSEAGEGISPEELERKQRIPWRKRLLLAFTVCLFSGFTLCFATPLEIVAGNSSSLIFGVGDVWLTMAAFTLAGVIVVSLILSALRGVAFNLVLALVFALGLCCWVQALFLNAGLPSADGSLVRWWAEHGVMMVVSLIVWIVLIVAAVVFACVKRTMARKVIAALSLVLIIVQGAGVASAVLGSDGPNSKGAVVATEAGMYEVSASDNVIVFILDAFDTDIMNRLTAEDKACLAGFDGFTWYDNSVGGSMGTEFCLPYLLTSSLPKEGQTGNEYRLNRYAEGTFIPDLGATGYSVGIYSDFMGLDYVSDDVKSEVLGGNTCNFKGVDNIQVSKAGTVMALMKCALYRDMPWILKDNFRFYTDYVNRRVVVNDVAQDPDDTLYMTNDSKYLARLQGFGLTVTADQGAFRFMHLNGAHGPWTTDEQGSEVGEANSSETTAAKGALHIVRTYMGYLKELGLYEDATIIVMADHGQWGNWPLSPLMMVKPAGKSSGFEVSHAPVSQADYFATVLSAMGSDAAAAKYGYRLQDVDGQAPRVRETYLPHFDGPAQYLERFTVSGYALDPDSWECPGPRWDFEY